MPDIVLGGIGVRAIGDGGGDHVGQADDEQKEDADDLGGEMSIDIHPPAAGEEKNQPAKAIEQAIEQPKEAEQSAAQ